MTQQIPDRVPGGGVDLSHLAARGQTTPGTGGAASPAPTAAGSTGEQVIDVPSVVLDVTDQTFEQVVELSSVVPVVIDLWAEWCQPCKTLGPILERVTRESAGRILLGKVDVEANPGLAQAFQAQSIPMVVALVAGRPVPLFTGAVPEDQVREFYARLLQLAADQGVSGRVNSPDLSADTDATEAETADAAPAEPEIPEAHRAAVEAAEAGDYARSIEEWDAVLLRAPADTTAKAARVQVRLLHRLQDQTVEEIRAAAGANPDDLTAQLLVADLDVSGGHIEDGLLRLLDFYQVNTDEDVRAAVRERLLELFEVVGVADPRVIAARGRLANLLY